MSDERTPDYDFRKRMPKAAGKKLCRIELFHVSQYSTTWSPEKSMQFTPRPPFRSEDRLLYWQHDLYRVRIDGVLYKPSTRYTFLTWPEIMDLFKEEMRVEP